MTRALVLPYSPFPYPAPTSRAAKLLGLLPPHEQLEGILLLATSHHDGAMPYQLLTKHYQSCLGPLQHPRSIAHALVQPRGWLTQESLRFRGEPSIEPVLLALRARYGASAPPVLTLLCGRACLQDALDEELLLQSASLLSELSNLLQGQRWLVIASAQLGPDEATQSDLDARALLALQKRDESFFSMAKLARIDPQRRPVGAAVLATMLSIMPDPWRCQQALCERVPALAQKGTVGHAYVRYAACAS